MHLKTVFRARLSQAAAALAALLTATAVFAAGNTLIPTDSNTGLNIGNAVVDGDGTNLLFWTYPHPGDPGAGKECPLNFYTVSLAPGLPDAQAKTAATSVCGNSLSRASLLAGNEVLILARDSLEHWRDGVRTRSQAFQEIPATSKMNIKSGDGSQWHDITAAGDVVLAVPSRSGADGKSGGFGLQVVSLNAVGGLRWQAQIDEPGQTLMMEHLWATNGGGAVIHAGAFASDYSNLNTRNLLFFIGANGARKEPLELTVEEHQPDMQTLVTMSPAELQKEMQRMDESRPESIRKLDVDARDDGGFNVLLQRQGGLAGREGYFLLHFAADGNLQSETNVTGPVAAYGLDDWKDFHVDGRKLILLARVLASQPSVQSRRKAYSQNLVASIDLDDSTLETRLLPLDLRYLQAVMDAGDEDLQSIQNWPGGDPELLTSLGGLPLAVSRGHLSGRAALRLNEATADLPAFTEAFEKGANDAARQAARKQGKADQAASKAQLNADLAAAAGMSPEQFAALSNQERKQVLANSGNYDAIAEAGIKQAPSVQAGMAGAAVNAEDINTQIATAMAEAQKSLPPDMADQVSAALAQVQQQLNAGGMNLPTGAPPGQTAIVDTAAEPASDPGAFSMTILDFFDIAGRGVVVAGRIDAGTVRVGDTVCLLSAKAGMRELQVESIELGRLTPESATAGDMPGIVLNGITTRDLSRNDQLRSSCGNRP